jgi:DNA-binding response OmpR family regulator
MENDVSSSPGAAPVAARRVLLVDDNADIVESLQILLESLGLAVAVANDAEGALAQAERFRPDVAVVDIGLRGTSGLALAPGLRALSPRGLRLVALSGFGADEDRARSLAAGFEAYLVKPVEIDELLAALAP